MGQDPEEALDEFHDQEGEMVCEECGEWPCLCDFDEGGESGC